MEVRLVAPKGGTPFAKGDGTSLDLERWSLLDTADVLRVTPRPARTADAGATHELEAVLTRRGRNTFAAAAARAASRRYCIVVGRTIDRCAELAPPAAANGEIALALLPRGQSEALRLAEALNATISTIVAEDARVRRASRASPRALLEHLYRRAVANHTPQWLDRQERETYLSRDLVALWKQVDAAVEGGNHDAILDADPVAATNGLTLKTYRIVLAKLGAQSVTARVTVGYAEKAPARLVIYDLVREGGRWRINEIRGTSWSLRTTLRAFIAASPSPRKQ